MSSASKKTPKQVTNGKGPEKSNSGKKLVQMRLPFKIITPKGEETTEKRTTQPAEQEPSTRKRTLSFGHTAKCLDDTNGDQPGQTETKKLKPTTDEENLENEIVKLSDSDDEINLEVKEEIPSGATCGKSNSNVSTFQIKLPMSSKKHKRRKSLKKTAEDTFSGAVGDGIKPERSPHGSSSDDIEIIADKLNPQKRQKIDLNNADEKTTVTEQHENNSPTNVIVSKFKEEISEVNDAHVDNQQETVKPKEKVGAETATEAASDNGIEKRATSNDKECLNDKSHIDLEVANAEIEVCQSPADITSNKHLTPKQQKLFEQRRQARQEKERKLHEARLQKQEEKEQRELAKKREREEKDEERRKEREAKDEQKRMEREEKERKRLAEVEAKNEEKRKRNEAKEEEQRKKDDERKRKEFEKDEAEQKKKRASEAFTKFFVAKPLRKSIQSDHDQNSNDTKIGDGQLAFRPFQVKDGMHLSPITRKTIEAEARLRLDNSVCQLSTLPQTQLYLEQLAAGSIIPVKWCRSANDNPAEDAQTIDDDLERVGQAIIEEQAPVERLRAKFLKFHENRRPPYYGTWRKRTQIITARQPFAQDKKYFDYEIDSDDEWEEEEPGESLDGSDDDKEERESEEEDYEVDNKWFVPHGHLSDEELQNDDEFGDSGDDNYSREAQKAKLQILQQEFVQEMKKETKKIKPRLIGCIWLDENGNQPNELPNIMWEMLDKRAYLCTGPIIFVEPTEPDNMDVTASGEEKTSKKLKRITLTPTQLKDLIRLLHGNTHAKSFIISEFIAYLKANVESIKNEQELVPAKSVLREKIDEYAEWKPVVVDKLHANATNQTAKKHKKQKKRLCWNVSEQVLQKYEMSGLTLDNNWSYVLQPKSANRIEKSNAKASDAAESDSQQSEGSEEQTQLTAKVAVAANKDNKKRVPLLMSVPLGQQIATNTKNMLISQFLEKSTKPATKAIESSKEQTSDY